MDKNSRFNFTRESNNEREEAKESESRFAYSKVMAR
jgi:hypothetical protein